MSSLGASLDSPSARLQTKAAGDDAVMEAFPDATIMRCGPLVGVEDRFYNDMANWRYTGGIPVIDGGVNKVQPVYVVDVAEAIYRSLEFADATGSVYDLGGPEGPMMCGSLPPLWAACCAQGVTCSTHKWVVPSCMLLGMRTAARMCVGIRHHAVCHHLIPQIKSRF